MKYEDIIAPIDQMKMMEGLYGWERTKQMVYELYKEKYFMPIPDDNSKLVKRFKYLMPGRIFTFKYDPLYKDELDFYDKRPVMLCFKHYVNENTGNNLQLGINLNFIPQEIRVFIISGIWKSFKRAIEKELTLRTPGEEAVGRPKLLFTDNFDVYGLLDYILETIGRTHWKFAIRTYIWDRIENAKWIDYPDWWGIPLLHSKDLIGISERELIKIYWKSKHKKAVR